MCFLASCLTCSRVSLASRPTRSRVLQALCLMYSRVKLALVLYVRNVGRALVSHVPLALHAFVSHLSRTLRAFPRTSIVSVFSSQHTPFRFISCSSAVSCILCFCFFSLAIWDFFQPGQRLITTICNLYTPKGTTIEWKFLYLSNINLQDP